ncbi:MULTISPECIES: rhodanese-related sulfurtransferase [unclassified Rathayibacter]|uniref:oxygen-dependent tRNA uridine(34) hydroxylase TrhO n=1 Tax=unclassified Rathayibacter TaxID=2609250 RepID=UPI00188B86F2|nr:MULTISPECIES: rhodanese-related sulfurtransferase [unclassified Rathayibacter]MBF4461437.1 rhodanese-related sulfurtransferase [Rathayibacter sp. VKM Ac-2879]MBF4502848.1 rhodanese-related sulfurtransferase [Rathayibacter sp. VKM Ac-2878]
MLPKILLFYRFVPLADPEAIRLWQRELCEALGLRGRLLLSPDGINGTLGGEMEALKRYVRRTREHSAFRGLEVKWSEGTGLDQSGRSVDFPGLSVKVRDEIVSFGAPGELRVDAEGVVGTAPRLTPDEVDALVADREDVVFFDGRNSFEAEIGRFEGAIVPGVASTREFVEQLDSGAYDHLKGRPVVTYCTGGIRCEVLSSLMRARGFGEVYQLDGGVVRYAEARRDRGLWHGALYVFDGRGSITFSPDTEVIGRCTSCSEPSSRMRNCTDVSCRAQLVVCESCDTAACASHAGPTLVG